MRSITHSRFVQFCALALMLAVNLISAQSQTTAFSYQGKLDDGGIPANGVYDFQFKLFDAPTGGASNAPNGAVQVGPTITINDLAITAGIFTTTLDFGAGSFPGDDRWLEISVRPGASTGTYTVLNPRRQITATPYAIKSLNAAAADSLSAACVNCVTSNQINSINSTQINGTITGSQLAVPLSLVASSANPILAVTNIHTSTAAAALDGASASTGFNAAGVRGLITSTSPDATSAGVRGITNSTTASGFGVFGSHAGTGAGVYGESPGGFGVRGHSTNSTGVTYGVAGTAISTIGIGVRGSVFTTTGSSVGVSGESRGDTGIGVRGEAGNASGVNFGVYGISQSTNGINASGVYGESKSSLGNGLFGYASSTTGPTYGVLGQSISPDGRGVVGLATHTSGINFGVHGSSASNRGAGVYGTVSNSGVQPEDLPSGVWGDVNGINRLGVRASNTATSGFSNGLLTTTGSASGYGLWAINQAFGVAGRFDGNVQVLGNLTKSSGTFKIDHPLDPENKYLYHSFVESPEMMNIYNGNVTTDAEGQAVVTLPGWFEALNRDFRYQLTVIGTFAQAIVAEEITGNSFKIITSAPNVKVSWQVTGVRQDAFANKHRIQVEEDKPETERGFYLHPDAFNQPEEKGVNWARNPGLMQELKESRERSLRGEPEPKPVLPTARRGNQ